MTTAPAELIIEGRIATLRGHSGLGWAEAIAVRGGRIMATGAAAQVEALVGPQTVRWRLAPDQVVMPSFTDAHLHLAAAAAAAGQPDLGGLDRRGLIEVIGEAHRERLERGDGGGWLLGQGWSFAALGEHPDAAWLDEAAPGRPVALWAHDHHSRWLSSRAVQVAGLARRSDPPAGRIERHADGRPTGIMYEAAAGLVDEAIPPAAAADVDRAIGAYAARLAEFGVTAVHDPGGLAPDPRPGGGPAHYRQMARSGRLPLRVVASVREEQLELAIAQGFRSGRTAARSSHPRGPGSGPAVDASPDGLDEGCYRDGWLKLFADGALGSRTAALLAPYEPGDAPGPPPGGPSGMLLRTREQLSETAGRAAAAGIASQIHAIGDAAVRLVLGIIEALPLVSGARHRIEHAQLVHPDDIARFGRAEIAASVQPCHLLSDAEAVRRSWGARSAAAFPLRWLAASGASLPFGSDAPVEPPDPWPGLAAATTRRGPGWTLEEALEPGQAISLERALRAACLDGPRSAGISDLGHLDAGSHADLLVLPARMFDVPPEPDVLATTRPLATLLAGRVVHQAPDFEP